MIFLRPWIGEKTHDNLWGLTIKKGKTHQEDLGTIDIVDMLRYLQD